LLKQADTTVKVKEETGKTGTERVIEGTRLEGVLS